MSNQDVETIVETLLRSRESLVDYERYQDLKLTSQTKAEILSKIGFCSACRRWYRNDEMAADDICLNCIHFLR